MVLFSARPASSTLFLYSSLSILYLSTTTSYGNLHNSNHPFQSPAEAVRRSAAEVNDESVLVLAASRTRRRDPTDDFRFYTGGWNISNNHYWASVSITALPMFVFAVVWFLTFGMSLCCMCCCYCCCSREPYGYSQVVYVLSLVILIIFTIASIIGCIVLYTGQGVFHGKTTSTLNFIINQADVSVEKLKNVSHYLAAAKGIRVDSIFLPDDVLTNIDRLQNKINTSATTLATKTHNKSRDIYRQLHEVGITLVIVAAAMLLLTFVGLLFSLFGLQCLVYTLVILGWILVAGTFILCAVFLLLHNVVTDSCVAMDEWVRYPAAHTALDEILPCIDNATTQETLLRSKDVTYQIVTVVNFFITNVSNQDPPPNIGMPSLLNFRQSGPKVPTLCNPFNPDYSNRQCASGEVDFSDANTVWMNYVCEVSASGDCKTTGRLTPDKYSELTSAVNVSYGLNEYTPFLIDLQDCTFVRQTFTDIIEDYCPGLKVYSKWVYIGLVMVSVAAMMSHIFWIIYGRERRHRVYTKQFHHPFERSSIPYHANNCQQIVVSDGQQLA